MNTVVVVGKIKFIRETQYSLTFSVSDYWGKDKDTGESTYNNFNCSVSLKSQSASYVKQYIQENETVAVSGNIHFYTDKNGAQRHEIYAKSISKVFEDTPKVAPKEEPKKETKVEEPVEDDYVEDFEKEDIEEPAEETTFDDSNLPW